jgi:multiple sugar transport system permease protein
MTDAIRKPWLGKKQKDLIKKILLHTLLIFLSFGFMFPFFWMLFTALKTPAELLMGTEQFFPKDPQWINFVTAVQAIPFLMYLKNSLFIVVMVMMGTLFSATTAAYAFAKLNWKGRDKWFIIML